jgi:hypothetical protein
MRARWSIDVSTKSNGHITYSCQNKSGPMTSGAWHEGKAGTSNRWSAVGYAAVFHHLNPCETYSKKYVDRAMDALRNSAKMVPEGHASSILQVIGGFLTAALAPAAGRGDVYRDVLDYYKYWLNIERCHDGSFYSSPKRRCSDAAHDVRYSPTGAVLVLLSGHRPNLEMVGRHGKGKRIQLSKKSAWKTPAFLRKPGADAAEPDAKAADPAAKAPETAGTAPGDGTKAPDVSPKPPAARPVADARTIAEWDAKLVDRTCALVDAKTRLVFRPSAVGIPGRILAASNATLHVSMEGGGTIELAWSRLKPADKRNLAIAMAASTDQPEDHALAAFHLLLDGDMDKAEHHLVRSGRETSRVRAAFVR